MFKIIVEEIFDETHTPQKVERYVQVVDDIDLPAVMAAANLKVNRKKRAPRTVKAKAQS